MKKTHVDASEAGTSLSKVDTLKRRHASTSVATLISHWRHLSRCGQGCETPLLRETPRLPQTPCKHPSHCDGAPHGKDTKGTSSVPAADETTNTRPLKPLKRPLSVTSNGRCPYRYVATVVHWAKRATAALPMSRLQKPLGQSTYIHTYIHTYVHTYIHTYIHIHAHMHLQKPLGQST